MDQDVEGGVGAMGRSPLLEDRVELLVGLDVARLDEARADRIGQRSHALLDETLDRREADLRAFGMQSLRDAPRDRVVVRHSEDQRSTTLEQAHRHPPSHLVLAANALTSSTQPLLSKPAMEPRVDLRGVPYRIVTNTSLWSRAALARYGESVGMRVSPDRIWSALSVSAAYTRRRFEHQPLYVLASEDARSEFVGQWLLSNAEAAARGA